jgi:colicin import membrane protein
MRRLYALPVIVLLLLGIPGVHADEPSAAEVKLFKAQLLLAKKGDTAGQYYLAEMYEKGLGTPQDMQQALVWYKKSAESGNPKAKEKLASWEKNQENARIAKERAESEARAAELARVKQQEEADAAAAARAKARAAAEAANKAAEEAKAAELAKAKQLQEAAAAKAKAAAEAARRAAEDQNKPKIVVASPTIPKNIDTKSPPAEPTFSSKEKNPGGTAGGNSTEDNETEGFTANPCKGPQAKFLSTCH